MTPEPQYATSSPAGQGRQLVVPRGVQRARNPPRDAVERVRLAPPARGHARVDDDELLPARLELVHADRIAAPLGRDERLRLDLLLAAAQRAAPRLEVDHRARVVAEVAEQPPEALGATERAVGDHLNAGPDPGRGGGRREPVGVGQRVPARPAGRRGEILLDVEERRAGDVGLEVEPAAQARVVERPAAVDELVAHV